MNKENKQGINSEYFIFLFIWIMCDDIEGVILAGSDYWGGYNPSNPPVNYAYAHGKYKKTHLSVYFVRFIFMHHVAMKNNKICCCFVFHFDSIDLDTTVWLILVWLWSSYHWVPGFYWCDQTEALLNHRLVFIITLSAWQYPYRWGRMGRCLNAVTLATHVKLSNSM